MRSLVVSVLRSETKVSRFGLGCYLCAGVSFLLQSQARYFFQFSHTSFVPDIRIAEVCPIKDGSSSGLLAIQDSFLDTSISDKAEKTSDFFTKHGAY